MSRERSPSPAGPSIGTFGGRKTGLDVQSFPIDADRVTIGRSVFKLSLI